MDLSHSLCLSVAAAVNPLEYNVGLDYFVAAHEGGRGEGGAGNTTNGGQRG